MRALVIPDVHLKPWMFKRAAELMREQKADNAVCLMDLADDWGKGYQLDLYEQTYQAATDFAEEFPDTLWCYGNHDLCYKWNERESGYSYIASRVASEGLSKLEAAIRNPEQIGYVQKIDNVLFSHGGVSNWFVKAYVPSTIYHKPDKVAKFINGLHHYDMWHDDSPIWLRPQEGRITMYKPRKLLQVVGHTPVEKIQHREKLAAGGKSIKENLISCDVFSTYSNGKPIGTQEFLLLDTETWEWEGVK